MDAGALKSMNVMEFVSVLMNVVVVVLTIIKVLKSLYCSFAEPFVDLVILGYR